MKPRLIYPIGTTAACRCAADELAQAGIPLIDHPAPEVTHLLLDVPGFESPGVLRGGKAIAPVLRMLPQDLTLVGGNLSDPLCDSYKTLDLLKQEDYVCANAAITAHCAIQVAVTQLPVIFPDAPALVIGWGRIGKCLCRLLRQMDCPVTVCIRDPAQRAMAEALGYACVSPEVLPKQLPGLRLLFNTAPAPVLTRDELSACPGCLKIDLASRPGLEGSDILFARGLPGQYAPESSGKLIAQTLMKLL